MKAKWQEIAFLFCPGIFPGITWIGHHRHHQSVFFQVAKCICPNLRQKEVECRWQEMASPLFAGKSSQGLLG